MINLSKDPQKYTIIYKTQIYGVELIQCLFFFLGVKNGCTIYSLTSLHSKIRLSSPGADRPSHSPTYLCH